MQDLVWQLIFITFSGCICSVNQYIKKLNIAVNDNNVCDMNVALRKSVLLKKVQMCIYGSVWFVHECGQNTSHLAWQYKKHPKANYMPHLKTIWNPHIFQKFWYIVQTFYKDIKATVIVNGHITQWFNIERGCRQGDPISPYLFIMCVEILAMVFREDEDMKGIYKHRT